MNIYWKNWCWSWNSNPLATWYKELTHRKRPDAGKGWKREEKGMTEDEMVGWNHQLDGHEFEQALGVLMDREAQCAAVQGMAKSWTQLSDWTELIMVAELENLWNNTYWNNNLPVMQETQVWSLGQEYPMKKDMAIHSSLLPQRTPWTEELGVL